VARVKVKRFREETYWGRPVPGFGDPAARLLIVGLAPAAQGGNRTGRVFTGDRSGDFSSPPFTARASPTSPRPAPASTA
jgi:uracil-DNA glycosylase